MDKLYAQLITYMHKQKKLLKKLNDIALNIKLMLINSDLKGLNDSIQIQHELNLKLEDLEKGRCDIVRDISEQLNLDYNNIANIINSAPEKYKLELESESQDLKNNYNEYKKIRQINKSLIKDNINYTDFMINIFSDEPLITYGTKGYKSQNENKKNFFDNKA